ncbi:unnamed protein product [Bemisia tabaci]|uniref:Uncharacterized protein n=1 Tax=Bemisia tabaci TaxID=7038 RepID=A0A9P0F468_BEMTA|nr:unnamed protein product [Bemisia tabaci]
MNIVLCIILPFVAAFLSTHQEDISDSSNVHLMPLVLEKEPSKKPPEIKKTVHLMPLVLEKEPSKKPPEIKKTVHLMPLVLEKEPSKRPPEIKKTVHLMPLVLEKEPSKKPPEIKKTRTNNDEVEDKTIEQIAHGQASWINNIKDEVLREEAIFNALKAEKIQIKQAHRENGKLSARLEKLMLDQWVVKSRIIIESSEVQLGADAPPINLNLTKSERRKIGFFEESRRRREALWNWIFENNSAHPQVVKIKNKIDMRKEDFQSTQDFSFYISIAFKELSLQLHHFLFASGNGQKPINLIEKDVSASRALEILLSFTCNETATLV